ncbi:hypothetical protein ACKFKG_28485 [Phormidesmis sp. 146-35]
MQLENSRLEQKGRLAKRINLTELTEKGRDQAAIAQTSQLYQFCVARKVLEVPEKWGWGQEDRTPQRITFRELTNSSRAIA